MQYRVGLNKRGALMKAKRKNGSTMIPVIFVIVISLSTVAFAISTMIWPDDLVGFEKYNPVYTEYEELGTAYEDTTLPESVRAFVSIPSDMDVADFVQIAPTVDSSTGTDYYDYYDYGYIQPDGAAEDYANGDMVIYSIFYADEDGNVGEVEYRVYGTIGNSNAVWFTCDASGAITGAVIDVPVTWEGEYDPDVIGEYTFQAVISEESSYTYNGEMPTAVITVYDITEDMSTEDTSTEDTSTEDTSIEENDTDDYGISTMSLADYEEDFLMSSLISEYVISRISSSGNADSGSSESSLIPGSWIDYLNTMWLNDVGTITYDDNGDPIWTSKCTWVDHDDMGGEDVVLAAWTGGGLNNDFTASTAVANYKEGTWHVYNAEHLIYAMNNYAEGDTISLERDIDLNGLENNWTAVELTETLTIDGNEHTIYNLASYVEVSYDDENEDGDIDYEDTRQSAFAYFNGYNATFTVTDLTFDTGKLVCDATINAPEGTTVEDTVVDYAIFGLRSSSSTLYLDNVNVENYLVISKASSVGILLGMNNSASWEDTTGDDLSDYDFNAYIDNCSVSDSWAYGHDHVGAIATFASDTAFTNSYVVGNTLISTGYHSGTFVSCLNNRSTFDSCFAADNYLYAATQSGGFVGYAGDAADYTNCYASGVVEGYSYIGGFAGATSVGHDYISATVTETVEDDGTVSKSYSYAYSSRNYNTFTNCYSTTLVGMRTETNNSGGFIGVVKFNGTRIPTEATVFDSCYAAGEVGSTQTINETNTQYVGGFVGYDQTYSNAEEDPYGTYITEYINCYYDKQTTAMREWVSGRYNSTDTTHLYEIDITGVLTSDTDKYGTGLASGNVGTAHTDEDDTSITDVEFGFIGFTDDDDWTYTEEHYPQLDVFAEASADDWSNPELVQAYSLASTATVILDAWDYGYNWGEDGIRSDEKELYSGTFATLADHIGDRYTYDTVREVVSNASITDSATFTEIVDGGILTQSYGDDVEIEYDDSKNILNKDELTATEYNGIKAFTLNNTADLLTVDAPGIDWYEIEEEVDEEIGSRPIRLISFMKVDAGEDQVFTAADTYDHKLDATFTMIDTLKENMVISLNAADAWSTSLMQSYPDNDAFYQVLTEATQFTASSDAWVNTEIWRADLVELELEDSDFTYDEETDMYYTGTGNDRQWYYIGQDGVIYYEEADGTFVELYASTAAEDGSVSYYTADYSVKVNGTTTGDDMTTTQAKWNGEIPLYPELADDQYYIVRYYWVLDNGRYRSDYKIITVTSDPVDIDQNHDVTIRVFNDADDTANEEVMAINADGYGVDTADDADEATTPVFSEETSSYDTTATQDEEGNVVQNVEYGEDSYVSWSQVDDNAVVTKAVLTMTSNNGYVVGTVEKEGELEVGDEFTIPIETFYICYSDENNLATQSTQSTIVELTYTVQANEDGGLYLEFDNTRILSVDDGTTDEKEIAINDTHYNITFDIYVQEAAEVTVTKDVVSDDEYNTESMQEQSFIVDVTGDLETQVVLKEDETSKPIVVYLYDEDTKIFYVDEAVPMEFELISATYTIEGDETSYIYTSAGITINEGDRINILITNKYVSTAYFKARDALNNMFVSSTE